jgi:DDE superfamily endonuclease
VKHPQWIHVLLPALLAALRTLGNAPARSLSALAQRLGVSEAAAATVVTPLEEEPASGAHPSRRAGLPPFAHDGTERRIVRPQDPGEQQESYSGKKKDNTVKNVLLVNALLTILFLRDTYGGRVHDLRIAEATPYPLPAGSGLLQDLGFLSFTLPEVAILMPTKKPRGGELTLEQDLANQALHQRRLRIEHVNSSVKRCRIVQDRIRLWKQGVRDLVMELCCVLHNFRVRLPPWQPIV